MNHINTVELIYRVIKTHTRSDTLIYHI